MGLCLGIMTMEKGVKSMRTAPSGKIITRTGNYHRSSPQLLREHPVLRLRATTDATLRLHLPSNLEPG